MNETKRVHSIARKIGNSWTLRAVGLMLALNVVFLLLILGGSAFMFERHAYPEDWQPGAERELVFPDESHAVYAKGYSIETPEGEWHIMTTDGSLYYTLAQTQYRFRPEGGEWHSVELRGLIDAFIPCGIILGALELILLLCEARRAHKKARRLLKPLDKIAQEMEAVSRLQNENAHYEDRLHDLENAIENLSPTHPDAQLRTGAQELTGLEGAINNLLMRMHESYRQQAQFVSDASHELRTPIAVIQGYAHMLARWGKDDAQVLDESIAAIQSESDYMKKLVEELLFLARGEIGRNPYDPQDISLTELIREVCDESAMIDPDHTWTFCGDGEIRVTADSGMLKQCARVLCENAQKYTPQGGEITLSVRQDGDRPCFSVQDEGIGIAQEDVSRIFDRFYRSDPARDRNSGGSGLGLSIAKWIIDRHGGYFEVLSRKDIGTRFTVTLPK